MLKMLNEVLMRFMPRVDVILVKRGERVVLARHVRPYDAIRLKNWIERPGPKILRVAGREQPIFPRYLIEFERSGSWGWIGEWPRVAAEVETA
jgi:hypothetical protein